MIEYKQSLELIDWMECDDTQKQLKYKNKRTIERNEKIQYFTTLLLEEKITVSTFLEAMANWRIIPDTI